MKPIRAGAVQFQPKPGDKRANLRRIRWFAREAARRGVDLLAFPEMCVTGYWHLRRLSRDAIEALSEPVPGGKSARTLLELSATHGMTLGAGLIEKSDEGGLFNSYVVAMPDGRTATHRKLHPFVSPHLTRGDRFTVFDTPQGCRVGVLICYDNNLIENVRITALAGAEVLLAPHQTGGCLSRSPRAMGLIDSSLWERRKSRPEAIRAELEGPKGRGWLMRWLPARAHDNGLFLVFSNGIGPDDGEIRTGNAMVLDPYGEILAETLEAGDALVVADLDPEVQATSTGRRWLEARRPELYRSLSEPTGKEKSTRQVRFGE